MLARSSVRATAATSRGIRGVSTSASTASTASRIAAGTAVGFAVGFAGPALMSSNIEELERRLRNAEQALNKVAAQLNLDTFPAGADFPHFTEKSKSLLKKHLSPAIYEELKDKVTKGGFTFARAIQSGVDNQDSGVGLYAGDEESYETFAALFDRVIEDYHNHGKQDKHVSDMDSSKLVGNPDPSGKYVISTRIRVGRNIRGLGLSPGIKRQERRKVEELVTGALSKMEGDLAGRYFSLMHMDEADRQRLVADHFLFKKGDRFLEVAGANRDWPESRGIFHNTEKTFLVWVNEEDQMRIISMQKGADAKAIFDRLSRGISAIEQRINDAGYEYMYNDHLGYIHSCPTNCGTGMRASVHVKLPLLQEHPHYDAICNKLRVQSRGTAGEHTKSKGGVVDISNKERLGKSEVQLVQTMIDGVQKLIQLEQKLEAGERIEGAW